MQNKERDKETRGREMRQKEKKVITKCPALQQSMQKKKMPTSTGVGGREGRVSPDLSMLVPVQNEQSDGQNEQNDQEARYVHHCRKSKKTNFKTLDLEWIEQGGGKLERNGKS